MPFTVMETLALFNVVGIPGEALDCSTALAASVIPLPMMVMMLPGAMP